jgi:hypothetical protein
LDTEPDGDTGSKAQCFKALIPLSKLKGLIDEDDITEVKETKCDSCANCPSCRLSARAKTRSLQEAYEQEVIEKSVTIDFDAKKVMVDLPFVRPPVEFLSKRHGRSDNYGQAMRIYKAQCRKPDELKTKLERLSRIWLAMGSWPPCIHSPYANGK